MESSRPVLLNYMLECAFSFLELKLWRKHASILRKCNIVQHAFVKTPFGLRFAPERYQWQAKTFIYVMVRPAVFRSARVSCTSPAMRLDSSNG
jgi:hypothetical protein